MKMISAKTITKYATTAAEINRLERKIERMREWLVPMLEKPEQYTQSMRGPFLLNFYYQNRSLANWRKSATNLAKKWLGNKRAKKWEAGVLKRAGTQPIPTIGPRANPAYRNR